MLATLLRHAAYASVFLCLVTVVYSQTAPSAAAQSGMQLLAQSNARIVAAVRDGRPGTALRDELTARHDLMVTVMRNQPAQARSLALGAAVRASLVAADPTADTLIERDATLTGELVSSVADDFNGGAAHMLYVLHGYSADTELSFAVDPAAGAALLHTQVTASGLSLSGVLAVEMFRPALPAECTPPPINVNSTAALPNALTSAAPATCSTLGSQKVAVLIVKFASGSPSYPTGLDQAAYWNQQIFGSNPSVTSFWNEGSVGQTSAAGGTFGPFTLASNYDCTTTSQLQTAAIAAAAGTVDFTQYNRIVIVYPVSTCTFGGLGNIGCQAATSTINHQYSVVWIPVFPNYNTSGYPQMWAGLSHELGHNLGLNHGNSLDFGSISLGPLDFTPTNPGTVTSSPVPIGNPVSAAAPIAGVNTEYGDYYSVMGYPWSPGGPYAVQQRSKLLNWIPTTDYREINSSGAYTIAPAETTSGVRGLHILRDPISSSWLWLEFRQALGYYTPLNLASITSNNLTSGTHIYYDNGFGDPLHTYELDMTPTATPNNFYDGNLTPGKSWSDPYSLLSLTVGTQTSSSLPILVSYDTPCATLALNPATLPAAAGNVVLTVTAPSNCAWTASTNASWLTAATAISGSGNGTVTFTAAANTTVNQRNTYITAQRQSVPLVQASTGLTITSVSPNVGSSAVGVAQPFTLNYSDTAGISDVQQVNFDLGGAPNCYAATVFSGATAYIYLYDVNTAAYVSGVTVNASGPVSGTPSSLSTTEGNCTLYAAGSKYVVNGTSAALTMNLSFTSIFTGSHSIFATISNASVYSSSIPLGTWFVVAPASVSVLPASGAQGATIPVTLTGMNTHFTSATTVAVSGTGVMVSGIAAGSSTSLTANLAIAANAATGARTLTITTGTEVVTTTFTVNAATASSVTLTPAATTIVLGATATFNATVSPSTATGTVNFYDGATLAASSAVTGGAASSGPLSFSAGQHSITAQYSGDATYSGSTSAAVALTVLTDYVWITNGNNSVSAISPGGSTIASGVTGGTAMAIDNSGNIWSLNSAANTVLEVNKLGVTVAGSPFSGGGMNAPTSMAIDGAGTVWVANGNNSVSVLNSSGVPISSTALVGGNLSAPTSIAIDSSGNLWVVNQGNSSVTEFLGVGVPVTTPLATGVTNNNVAAKP